MSIIATKLGLFVDFNRFFQRSVYIPEDIAQEIQSFLGGRDLLNTFLVCKSFTKTTPDVNTIYHYKNPKVELPKWVTKIKVGKRIAKLRAEQVTYLDFTENWMKDLSGFPRAKTVKLGDAKIGDELLDWMPDLEELWMGGRNNQMTGSGFKNSKLKILHTQQAGNLLHGSISDLTTSKLCLPTLVLE